MKLKVCGMKHNVLEVATLKPDYLGFIFWEPSERSFEGDIPKLPRGIKKVGVFVDASLKEVNDHIFEHALDMVQLHGHETPAFCAALKDMAVEVVKVFSIQNGFDFEVLKPFEESCDYFLFDTKGKLPGGNGYVFDWSVLKDYASSKPYFLSGGIGLEEMGSVKEFLKRPESRYCHAIDVNSRFESGPGLKEVDKLKEFKKQL
ncbi:MAG: phosphoribosylanthranilate isomerase [Flavobacteriaceae bacterium]